MRSFALSRKILAAAPMGVLLWGLLHAGFACGDSGGTGAGGEGTGGDPYADVAFEAGANDEALDALLAATPSGDISQAAYLLSPADGTTLDAASPTTFSWQVGATARIDRDWFLPGSDLRLGRAAHARLQGPASELRALLGPIRAAHAHGDPVNGSAFLLLIRDARGVDVHRAFTTALEHTPTQEAWTGVAAAEGPLEACILSAVFEDNRIAPDGGPFEGPWIALSF